MATWLREVEIENFRGFAECQVVPLDGDVVLISGGNGTGKTSLTDAITWTLTGDLPGLAKRLKGERKGEDFVLSRYGTGPARVRLSLEVDGETVDIERRGSASGSEIRITPSDDLASSSEDRLTRLFGFEDATTMAVAIHAWGVLRQDAMRATLEEGSEALHRRLREILGLSALAAFEAATKETAQALQRKADEARVELDRLVQQQQSTTSQLDVARSRDTSRGTARASAAARLERLTSRPPAEVRVALHTHSTSADIAEAGSQVAALLRDALEIAQQLAGLPDIDRVPSESDLAALRAQHDEAKRMLVTSEVEHTAQVRMAEAALALLSDHCPVCAQSIDEEEVRRDLQNRVGGDADGSIALRTARERVAAARAALEEAETAARRANAAARSRQQAVARWTQSLSGATLVEHPESWHDPESIEPAQAVLQTVRDELRAVYRDLVDVETAPVTARLSAQVADLKAGEVAARQKAEESAKRAQLADALRRAATDASVEITQQSLEALEPAFAEVYDRLAPHPSFTQLEMMHDVFYGKGRSSPRIVDPVRGIAANPNLVCSEGQLNVVALSYFLALNLETERGGLPFAILDDPLQAMDVINVLGFCDVARALRERRQLMITTHDRRFASLLERKLTPRQPRQKTLHLQFTAWDRSGPRIDVVRPPVEDVPRLLAVA